MCIKNFKVTIKRLMTECIISETVGDGWGMIKKNLVNIIKGKKEEKKNKKHIKYRNIK